MVLISQRSSENFLGEIGTMISLRHLLVSTGTTVTKLFFFPLQNYFFSNKNAQYLLSYHLLWVAWWGWSSELVLPGRPRRACHRVYRCQQNSPRSKHIHIDIDKTFSTLWYSCKPRLIALSLPYAIDMWSVGQKLASGVLYFLAKASSKRGPFTNQTFQISFIPKRTATFIYFSFSFNVDFCT